MPRRKQPPELSELSTHALWGLAFKLRHEAVRAVQEFKAQREGMDALSLLGMVLNELCSRGLQGKLDL